MTVRYTLAWVICLSLLVAAAFWARGRFDDKPVVASTPPATASPRPPTDPLPAPAPAPVLPATLPPLPADDTPIAAALPSLQARADAGDSQAACRLGIELLRCSHRDNLVAANAEAFARQERQLEAKGQLDDADEVAASLLANADLQRRCAGLDAAQIARAGHYVRQAALAGEPEAVLRYAQGETLGPGNFRFVRSPAFDTWRREARPLLERALRAGQPAAVLAMAQVHHDDGWLAMLFPRDPLEAEVNLALARRLFGDDASLARYQPGTALDAEGLVRAQRLAAERHERDFRGARWPLAQAAAVLAPLHALHESPWPASGPGDRVPCAGLSAAVAP